MSPLRWLRSALLLQLASYFVTVTLFLPVRECHCFHASPQSSLRTLRKMAFSSSTTLEMSKTTTTPSGSSQSNTIKSNPNHDETNPIDCDVAIIGAGPAGLVLGHALHQRGYSIKIIERRSSFRPVGSAVFLHPFALHSLRSISPHVEQEVIDAATNIGSVSMRSITNPSIPWIFILLSTHPFLWEVSFYSMRRVVSVCLYGHQ